jgi:hypothetical protein
VSIEHTFPRGEPWKNKVGSEHAELALLAGCTDVCCVSGELNI